MFKTPYTIPINLYNKHKSQFETYLQLLLKWNEKINLTSLTQPDKIRELHFLDALAFSFFFEDSSYHRHENPGQAMDPNLRQAARNSPPLLVPEADAKGIKNVSRETFSSILDIGSGNGVPGLVLKIIYPHIKVTLAESIQKKCAFIKAAARELGLKDVTILNQTIDTTPITSGFDAVISRATCSLKEFSFIGAPQLKPGGLLATLKGEKLDTEIQEANSILSECHLSSFSTEPYTLTSKECRKIVWSLKRL